MDFIELKISCVDQYREILIAELAALGFESMMDTDQGFNAYISKNDFKEDLISGIIARYGDPADLSYEIDVIKQKNWNEEWERNFDPIIIDKKVAIRATFHQPLEVPCEILIDPRMAFGTGHHETTQLMIKNQLKMDHTGKKVLDCGCGTGVLAILAWKLGAEEITGIDIDEWAVENSMENARLNGIKNLLFFQGSIRDVNISGKYDMLLANINKNVLIDEMLEYSSKLSADGKLLISGFYVQDLEEIKRESLHTGLKFCESTTNNNWAAAIFIKE